MENKLSTLIEYLKQLCSVDLDRVISFALGIVTANNGQPDRPVCPHCGGKDVIKYGHKGGKQRFLCHTCNQTFMHTTNTLMENSHYPRSVWADFIRDTITGVFSSLKISQSAQPGMRRLRSGTFQSSMSLAY